MLLSWKSSNCTYYHNMASYCPDWPELSRPLSGWEHLGRHVMTKLKTQRTAEQPQSCTACSNSHRAAQHAQRAAKLQTRCCPSSVHTCQVYTEPVFVIQMWKRLSLNILLFYVLLWIKYLLMTFENGFFFILTFLELGLYRPNTLLVIEAHFSPL